jgi:hypothetical protein
MATVSDLTNTPLSGLNHIDALLDTGPDWNYLTTPVGNTIYYTFSVTTGNEEGRSGQEAFTLSQQNYARQALMEELGRITGIRFVETTDGAAAQIHFCNIDIQGSTTTGLCSWSARYSYDNRDNLVSFEANAYVYLDNAEWYAQNRNLAPGGYGYQTLLHELGHALGLKHPFDDDIHLPTAQDNTGNTLMSYVNAGGPYQHFSQYDIAALNWLYGGDGLGGKLGIHSLTGTRYFTGTIGNDKLVGTMYNDMLEGGGGDDLLDGGAGIDTAVFRGARSDYKVAQLADGSMRVAGIQGGGDTLMVSIERIKFSDKWLALDVNGTAGQVYRLYQAAFDRVPDAGGFSFWLDAADSHGVTLNQMAGLFLGDKEANLMYMADPSDEYFLTQLYAHVLHRKPDQAGLDWWLSNIRASSRAEVLAMFTESTENQAQVIGTIQNGIEYTPWT